jgi:hypothetical protein
MRYAMMVGTVLLLAACTGSESSPADLAAQACEQFAKGKLEGQTYQLDLAALAASMRDEAGMKKLVAPILINPGLANEERQTFECTVRMAEGTPPTVMGGQFIW